MAQCFWCKPDWEGQGKKEFKNCPKHSEAIKKRIAELQEDIPIEEWVKKNLTGKGSK